MNRFVVWLLQFLGILPRPDLPSVFVVPAKLVNGKLVALTRNPSTAMLYDRPPYRLSLWADIADDDLAQRLDPVGDPAYQVTPGVKYRTRAEWKAWAKVPVQELR
jgi:hypothetical protein